MQIELLEGKFWTKQEYDKFIVTLEPGTENYLMAEILFWTVTQDGESGVRFTYKKRKNCENVKKHQR